MGRREVVNAKKAEERQRLEEQLSSAELMHLVAEFGRRIKELEGRAAAGDKVRGCDIPCYGAVQCVSAVHALQVQCTWLHVDQVSG